MPNVLITGANRGIGLAFAQEYLRRGARVIATCRNPLDAAALHDLANQHPDALTLLPMDVTDLAQIAACRTMLADRIGALHLLINNAGILRKVGRLAEIEMDDLMESFQVNAVAPVMVAKAFAGLLEAGASQSGAPSKLINITMPTPPISKWNRTDNQIYVASRYALNALTKMIALELCERNIITVGLHPGYVQTDMNNYSSEACPADQAIPKAAETIEALTPDQNGLALLQDGKVYEW